MASRPAKRQRRSTVILSDDDEDIKSPKIPIRSVSKASTQLELDHQNGSSLTLSPKRPKVKASVAAKKSVFKPSPKSSPEKSKKPVTTKNEFEKNKSLHTFFSKASEEQRWHTKSATPEIEIEDGEFGDAIEDDESQLGKLGMQNENTDKAKTNLNHKDKPQQRLPLVSTEDERLTPSASQRFVRPTTASTNSGSLSNSFTTSENLVAQQPWADRYGPANLEELAVHKKKVADVQRWLEDVLYGRARQKLLVLKGPAGSGKTTTVSLLSRSMGFRPVFWNNPDHSDAGTSGSVASQFDDFLTRAGEFSGLSLSEDTSQQTTSLLHSNRHVLVVEEFPATITRFSGALDSFRSVILQFLSRNASAYLSTRGPQATYDISPLIMIISETLLSSSTAFSDSFTVHRLLGPEILNHPLVTSMEFNPIAPTFVRKALDLVLKKEVRDSKRRRIPGSALLQKLAEVGDVRSATNSLEFLCVRGDSNSDWSGTVAAKTKKSSKDSAALTEMESSSLQLISQRETTLDMFHAAGKIMYNKREDPRVQDTRAQPPPKPPDHLLHLYTPKVSQVDIEALLNETGTDIQTFISTLHENYVLSCNGDSFIDCLDDCSEMLSISDVLNPDSRRTQRNRSGNAAISQSNVQAGTSDTLRQDEISFHVASRGLLFHLPYPVNRAMPTNGRKSDSFKMFYPASLRLWKPMEEVESLIALFRGSDTTILPSFFVASGGVASWRTHANPFGITLEPNLDQELDTPLSGLATHDLLVMDILPYMTKIQSSKNGDTNILSKITQFNGIAMSGEEPSDDELADEETVTIKNERPAANVLRGGILGNKDTAIAGSASMGKVRGKNKEQDSQMEKLYISDDDIQDD